MQDSNKWQILLAVVALVIMLTLVFFEIKDVPKIKWESKIDLNSKSAGGFYLFKSLLDTKYDSVTVTKSDSLILEEDQEESTLLIYLTNKIRLDDSTLHHLKEYIKRGNNALLLSSSIHLRNYNIKTIGKYSHMDTSSMLTWNDSTEFQYKKYWSNLEYPKKVTFSLIDQMADSLKIYDYKNLMTTQDTTEETFAILRSYKFGEGQLVIHSMPELFHNLSSLQNFYLDNFEKTFDLFDSNSVRIHQHKRANILAGRNEDSPIQYILSEKSLKAGYYLLIFTALLYALFASKRKQKSIPTLPENKNTSLTYVKTMSELYKAQDQNEKLVPHMEKIFTNKIKNKYYLDPKSEDYPMLLSLKSKIPIEDINKILLKFESAKSHDFSDDQIINLHNDIISFHKKAN